MARRGRAVGGLMVCAGGFCALGLAAVIWGGAEPVAAAEAEAVVRLHGGVGYVPHDAARFDALAVGLTALPEAELAQMAGFADALAADLDEYTPEDLAGRIGDLLTVVDLAYADAQRARPETPGYDADALRGITDRIGYDTDGLTDG